MSYQLVPSLHRIYPLLIHEIVLFILSMVIEKKYACNVAKTVRLSFLYHMKSHKLRGAH